MTGTVVAAILLWAILGKIEVIPPGTALPISLDCTLDAKKVKPGQPISGTVAQDVPLGPRTKIRAGSRLKGHVVDVGRKPDGSSYIRLRFDLLRAKKNGDIQLTTSLRAVASPWEVQEAQLPKHGSIINPLPTSWTTYQVGGDRVFRGGGHVMHEHEVVGDPVSDGVMAQLISVQRAGCIIANGDRKQALWVFGSAACGPYGFFDHLDVGHAGDADPLGDIVLQSDKNVRVPTGSGMLLMSLQPPRIEARR